MRRNVGVASRHRLADEIERHGLPGDLGFRVDAGLGQRDLERDLWRRADAIGGDRLALHAREILDPGLLRGEQALATAMRADEQFDVKPLLQRLQPIADEARAGVRLAGGERLNQRLPARALIEQFDVEIVLGVKPLGHAEAERRMAGRHLRPGEADFRSRRRDGRGKHLDAQRARRSDGARRARRFQHRAARDGVLWLRIDHVHHLQLLLKRLRGLALRIDGAALRLQGRRKAGQNALATIEAD